MFNLSEYMKNLTSELTRVFGDRLFYIGLQGSYARGEADESSDLDVMVVLDRLGAEDLCIYRNIVSKMEHYEKSCGFICGKEDLTHWCRGEICQLVHETIDYYGELKTLVPSYTDEDVKNYVQINAGNLYHEICHRYVHASEEVSRAGLRRSFKAVFYILQNYHYLISGVFLSTKAELLKCLEGIHLEILELAQFLREHEDYDISQAFSLLLLWCQEILRSVAGDEYAAAL